MKEFNGKLAGTGFTYINHDGEVKQAFLAQVDWEKGITIKFPDYPDNELCLNRERHEVLTQRGTYDEHFRYMLKCAREGRYDLNVEVADVFPFKTGERNWSASNSPCAF